MIVISTLILGACGDATESGEGLDIETAKIRTLGMISPLNDEESSEAHLLNAFIEIDPAFYAIDSQSRDGLMVHIEPDQCPIYDALYRGETSAENMIQELGESTCTVQIAVYAVEQESFESAVSALYPKTNAKVRVSQSLSMRALMPKTNAKVTISQSYALMPKTNAKVTASQSLSTAEVTWVQLVSEISAVHALMPKTNAKVRISQS